MISIPSVKEEHYQFVVQFLLDICCIPHVDKASINETYYEEIPVKTAPAKDEKKEEKKEDAKEEQKPEAPKTEKVKKERNVVFLDVRTDKERKQSSIKGSYHIPVTSLKDRQQELKKFKDAEIICFCQTGSRSLTAASKLKKMGFKASNLSGGMIRWNASGLR